MRLIQLLLASLALAILGGCAHPINVEPELGRISSTTGQPLPIKVGYFLPNDLVNLEVTTPGGGGDSVRYNPYASVSMGYQQMLSQVFSGVVSVSSLTDFQSKAGGDVDYVLTPNIVTNSGGSNFFTWPPETFSVDLTSTIRDKSGKVVASPRVVGMGTATTSERISDYGFSGRRAFEDALRKMNPALREWAAGLGATSPKPANPAGSTAERLKQLRDLLDRGLITDAEHEAKRKSVLADL